MEVTAADAAVAFPLLILGLASLYLRWKVIKKAAETGRPVQISGLNPLAPKIDFSKGVKAENEVEPHARMRQRANKTDDHIRNLTGGSTNARASNSDVPIVVPDVSGTASNRRTRRPGDKRQSGATPDAVASESDEAVP